MDSFGSKEWFKKIIKIALFSFLTLVGVEIISSIDFNSKLNYPIIKDAKELLLEEFPAAYDRAFEFNKNLQKKVNELNITIY